MKESYPALPFLNIMHWYIYIHTYTRVLYVHTKVKKKQQPVFVVHMYDTKQNGNTKLGNDIHFTFYV